MNKKIIIISVLFLVFFVISRVINLNITVPFNYDEANDLPQMYHIYKNNPITFIGPVNTDGTKVFSSLTYYMYLPFAIAGGFEPYAPAYGGFFWGILTTIAITYIGWKLGNKSALLALVFAFVWYPFVITQRHAYNPNPILVWIPLGILASFSCRNFFVYLSGLLLGLSIHHHYLAAAAVGTYLLIRSWEYYQLKRYKAILLSWCGLFTAIAPFILFDLTHLPGVFLLRYLFNSYVPQVGFSLSRIPFQLLDGIEKSFLVIAPQPLLAFLIGLGSLCLFVLELKKKDKSILWTLPFIAQMSVGIILAKQYELWYIYAGLPFYLVWLLTPRKHFVAYLQTAVISLLIGSSVLTFVPAITKPTVQPPVQVIMETKNILKDLTNTYEIKNPNITTVASPDSDLLAYKYRAYMDVFGVKFRQPSEYDLSENLFVISTESFENVMKDASVPIAIFRDRRAILKNTYVLSIQPWKLYWLGYE